MFFQYFTLYLYSRFIYIYIYMSSGDRLWYETGGFESSFTLAQLQQIRKITLARILCDNLDGIDTLQPFVFLAADNNRWVTEHLLYKCSLKTEILFTLLYTSPLFVRYNMMLYLLLFHKIWALLILSKTKYIIGPSIFSRPMCAFILGIYMQQLSLRNDFLQR